MKKFFENIFWVKIVSLQSLFTSNMEIFKTQKKYKINFSLIYVNFIQSQLHTAFILDSQKVRSESPGTTSVVSKLSASR